MNTLSSVHMGLDARVRDLDLAMGDPDDPANPWGFTRRATRDEACEAPPVNAVLNDVLRLSFAPAEDGGTLRSLDETLMGARIAARRDPALMPETMFSITAATTVLAGGTRAQCDRVLRAVGAGGSVGLALSEPEHDTDPTAGDCALIDEGGRMRLSGTKWRVGITADLAGLVVLARYGGRGPASLTAVLLDGDQARSAMTGSTARTDGFRGVRFAEFRFDGLEVDADALVGGAGRGMELALRAMQLVRVIGTAAPVGSADTALRCALNMLAHSGDTPDRQRVHELGTAGAALFASDIAALTAARSMHVFPGCQALWSTVVKRVVTELIEYAQARIGDAIGFRAVLREGPTAPLALARRDDAVVRHIDTDPIANLHLLAQQLTRQAVKARSATGDTADIDRLRTVFTLDAPLPAFDPRALKLNSGELDPVLAAVRPVAAEVGDGVGDARREVDLLVERAESVWRRVLDLAGPSRPDVMDVADEFVYVQAAACALLLWWANRDRSLFGATAGSTGWLHSVLRLLRDRAAGGRGRLDRGCAVAVFERIEALRASGRTFGAAAVALAEAEGGRRDPSR
jgi:alkylation response protein AidB-like acyl-CoA dehydrogenase